MCRGTSSRGSPSSLITAPTAHSPKKCEAPKWCTLRSTPSRYSRSTLWPTKSSSRRAAFISRRKRSRRMPSSGLLKVAARSGLIPVHLLGCRLADVAVREIGCDEITVAFPRVAVPAAAAGRDPDLRFLRAYDVARLELSDDLPARALHLDLRRLTLWHAAGSCAAKIDRGGAYTCRLRKVPPVGATSGLMRNLKASRAADRVCEKPEFKQPPVCGAEPVRSRWISEPAMVTFSLTLTGSGFVPSLSM